MEHGAALRMQWGGSMGRQVGKKHYGRIWPNGNFSLGLGPVASAALDCDESGEGVQARYGAAGSIGDAVAFLISSNALNSHTPKTEPPQRGLKGITALG